MVVIGSCLMKIQTIISERELNIEKEEVDLFSNIPPALESSEQSKV